MRRLALTVALVTLGCAPAKPDYSSAAAAASSFIQSVAQITCTYDECMEELSPTAIQQACAMIPQYALDEASNVSKAVLAGRTTFNSAEAQACLSALAALNTTNCWGASVPRTTPDTTFNSPACNSVFTGTVAPGDTCYESTECLNGFCNANLNQCPGQCQVDRTADTLCESNSECSAGMVCYSATGGEGYCATPAAAGASCLAGPCQDGLVCAGAVCVTPAAGMSCSSGGCGANLTCQVNETTGAGTCAALLAAGAACSQSADCAGNQLCAPTTNTGAFTCTSPGGMGAACSPNAGAGGSCFADLICDSTSLTCVTLPGVGQPCNQGQCASTAYCDQTGASPTCAALKAAGAPCTSSQECKEAACSGGPSGVCLDDVVVGEDCVEP